MGLEIFTKVEKVEQEKKLEVVTSDGSIRDKRVANLLVFGKTFYSNKKDSNGNSIGVADAFRQALDYAGKDGFVASMPELIAAKCLADKNHDFWKKWYTAHSEEDRGVDRKGLFGKKNEGVLVVVHGGGILTPNRIEKAYANFCVRSLVNRSAQYTSSEFDNLLEGKLPSGETIKLYSLDDLKKETPKIRRFGVVIPYEVAQATKSDWNYKKEFVESPLVIARNGGLENLDAYFDKAKCSDGALRNFHTFGNRDVNSPKGRLLFLYSSFSSLNGNGYLYYNGHFVGVSAGGA